MFTKISIISALTIGLLGSALATPMPLDVEILREGEVANLTDRAALTAFAYRWCMYPFPQSILENSDEALVRLDQCRANDPDQDIRRGGEYGTCYTAPDSGFGHATVQYDRAVCKSIYPACQWM